MKTEDVEKPATDKLETNTDSTRPASRASTADIIHGGPRDVVVDQVARRVSDLEAMVRPRTGIQLSTRAAAPPPPVIMTRSNIDSGIFRVTFRCVDNPLVVAYNVYRSRQFDNSGVATFVQSIAQPQDPTRAVLTFESTTAPDSAYWIASVNSAGIESPRVLARQMPTDQGGVPSYPVQVGPFFSQGYSPSTIQKNASFFYDCAKTSGDQVNSAFVTRQSVANATGSIQALEAYVVTSHATGTVNLALGLVSNIECNGAGTITSARSTQAGIVLTAGTITTATAFWAGFANPLGTGAATTAIAFFVNTFPAGCSSKYAFYCADSTAPAYIAGGLEMDAGAEIKVNGTNIVPGVTGTTLTLAKVTTLGSDGSITFNDFGIITDYTAPT